MPTNFEFKARVSNLGEMEAKLQQLNPEFRGEDHQVDTYFNVTGGRLKIREGNIENALIHYNRIDEAGSKQSDVTLYPLKQGSELKEILAKSIGVRSVVDKMRRIYFVENVKFHFDRVAGLGEFIEVEAIDQNGSIPVATLRQQCLHYAEFFDVQPGTYISNSYSDMTEKHADPAHSGSKPLVNP